MIPDTEVDTESTYYVASLVTSDEAEERALRRIWLEIGLNVDGSAKREQ